MMEGPTIHCCGCDRRPEEIGEYIGMAEEYGLTPDEFVRAEEGTYNRATGHFWCTDCYIRAGTPLGTAP
jgi:hypothetical protein